MKKRVVMRGRVGRPANPMKEVLGSVEFGRPRIVTPANIKARRRNKGNLRASLRKEALGGSHSHQNLVAA